MRRFLMTTAAIEPLMLAAGVRFCIVRPTPETGDTTNG